MSFKFRKKTVFLKGRKENFFRELDFISVIDDLLPNNPVVIDCGANIGNYTVYFSLFKDAKKIYSFEPMIKYFNFLKKNILLNKIDDKVTLFNAGTSNKNGKISLISTIPGSEGAFWFWYKGEEHKTPFDQGYIRHKEILDSSRVDSETVRLDDAISCKDKIDFIKIDVEGMEYETILGASQLIKNSKPLIYVETSVLTQKNLLRWMTKNKYSRIKKDVFNGHNWLLKSDGK